MNNTLNRKALAAMALLIALPMAGFARNGGKPDVKHNGDAMEEPLLRAEKLKKVTEERSQENLEKNSQADQEGAYERPRDNY